MSVSSDSVEKIQLENSFCFINMVFIPYEIKQFEFFYGNQEIIDDYGLFKSSKSFKFIIQDNMVWMPFIINGNKELYPLNIIDYDFSSNLEIFIKDGKESIDRKFQEILDNPENLRSIESIDTIFGFSPFIDYAKIFIKDLKSLHTKEPNLYVALEYLRYRYSMNDKSAAALIRLLLKMRCRILLKYVIEM
jgi:hypothetical protein